MQRVLILSFFLIAQNLFGQGVRVNVDVYPYWSPESGHYVEITYSVDPNTLYSAWNKKEAPQLGFVTLVERQGTFISVDKFNLVCPEQDPKAEILYPIVQNAFLGVDTGFLQVTVLYGLDDKLTDTLRGGFYLNDHSEVNLASLQWKERLQGKLGPRAQFGQAVFTNDSDKVYFYTEAYRLPKNQKAYFSYEVYSLDTDRPMEGYGGVMRLPSTTSVQPIQGGVQMKDLPTGQYELRCTLNIQGMETERYPQQRLKFYRVNPTELARWNEEVPIDPRWMGQLGTGDSLRHWINGFYPIASIAERQQIERMGPGVSDTLLWRFAQRFWESRYPVDAFNHFVEYKNLLRMVDGQYSSRAVPGYATDRGRIFLQYGPPTLTEKRPFETDGYPYEIWQYNTLDVPNSPYQINKIFVFVNYAVVGRNYELLHSDAIGEVYNSRWKVALQKRSYITEDIDDTGQTGFDKFGSRIYNNIIPGGK